MDNHQKRFQAYRKLGFFPNSILDIGAYEGHWTKMIRQIYPTATNTMIEANKDKKEILEKMKKQKSGLRKWDQPGEFWGDPDPFGFGADRGYQNTSW